MANKTKRGFRLNIVKESTEETVRSFRFTRAGAILAGITAFVIILGSLYALIALTPLRTTIPGYPDAHFRREAVANAIKIDSLESAITRWKLYSENLSRVLAGDTTINLDSLLVIRDNPDSLSR